MPSTYHNKVKLVAVDLNIMSGTWEGLFGWLGMKFELSEHEFAR